MDQQHVNPYNAGPAQISSPLASGSTMASPTAVEFALDFDDYLAWNFHKLNSTPGIVRQRRRRVIVLTAAYLTLGIILYFQFVQFGQVTALIVGGAMFLAAILSAVYFPFRYRRAIRKHVNLLIGQDSNRSLFSHRRLEIAPAGLFLKGELFESLFRWPMVVRLDVTEKHAFFDLGGAGGVILPRFAFTHDAVFQAFLATARRYQQQAIEKE